jgi:hypothetical protein
MSLQQGYLKVLSRLPPVGAVGLALLLGASTSAIASSEPARLQPKAAAQPRVAERLAAIRDAVSTVAEQHATNQEGDKLRLAWGNWWRNWGWRPWWGWGWPNWNNWHNWNNWPNWWHNW